MEIQSGLEPRNTLLMVLRVWARGLVFVSFSIWPITFDSETLHLWQGWWGFFFLILFIHLTFRQKSPLSQFRAHGFMRGQQKSYKLIILFKWNDVNVFFVFFPLSVVWICLQLFPDSARQTGSCPRNRTANPVFFPCSPLAAGGTGWSCDPEQLRSTNLYARKCFSVTLTRTLRAAPCASFLPNFKPTFASLVWDQDCHV